MQVTEWKCLDTHLNCCLRGNNGINKTKLDRNRGQRVLKLSKNYGMSSKRGVD